MKAVLTIGHHSEHLTFFVIAQANRAHRIVGIFSGVFQIVLVELEFRVRIDDCSIESDWGRSGSSSVLVVGFVFFGDEDDAGDDDPGGGGRCGGGGRKTAAVSAARAAADVGGKEKSGEEDEEAEGDSEGVPEADGFQGEREGRRRW